MDARKARYKLSPRYERVSAPLNVARTHTRARLQSGFTFLEVIVALALLAASASILIGMEGAAVRRTIRDTRGQQAMLALRSIMSSIESIKEKEIPIGTQENRPVLDLLQELGQPAPTDESAAEAFSVLSASILIEEFALPLSEDEVVPLQRVAVAVMWGQNQDEAIAVTYIRAQGS